MRVYLDTEFLERGSEYSVDLISIGLVAADGREYYAVHEQAPWFQIFQHGWLMKNVVPHLPVESEIHEYGAGKHFVPSHADYYSLRRRGEIAAEVEDFLLESVDSLTPAQQASLARPPLEIWTDCGGYDRVMLGQLWGRMTNMPSFIPFWQHDLRSLMALEGVSPSILDELDVQKDPHHALVDARVLRTQVEYVLRALDRL